MANQKGGVGKTTTAVNLATSLALRSRRVLLADLDPQGNASTNLGVEPGDRGQGSYGLFGTTDNPIVTPRRTSVGNLSVVSAGMDLAGIDLELGACPDRALRLRQGLHALGGDPFDILVLDCPPSFGLLTLNALAAADFLLIPLQCEFFALEGLAHLKRTVDAVRQAYNPKLSILGIVLTMFDRRNNLSDQVARDVRSFFGEVVLRTVIPRNVRLSEAPSHGLPIACYDPKSAGAVAYQQLADEVIGRIESGRHAHA